MCGSGLVYIVYLDLRLPLCVLYMILYAACSGGMGEWDQEASGGQGWKVASCAGVFLLVPNVMISTYPNEQQVIEPSLSSTATSRTCAPSARRGHLCAPSQRCPLGWLRGTCVFDCAGCVALMLHQPVCNMSELILLQPSGRCTPCSWCHRGSSHRAVSWWAPLRWGPLSITPCRPISTRACDIDATTIPPEL
jgi:hypothetical protein